MYSIVHTVVLLPYPSACVCVEVILWTLPLSWSHITLAHHCMESLLPKVAMITSGNVDTGYIHGMLPVTFD